MAFGFIGGLTEGIEAGSKLGFMSRQLQQQDQLRAAEEAKNNAEAAKIQQEVGLQKLQRATDLFKDAPDSLKPEIYKKSVAPLANKLFNSDLDPNAYGQNTAKTVKDFGDWLNLHTQGKISYDDFLNGAGLLRAQMSKDDSSQVGNIISDLPDVKAAAKREPKTITPEDAAKRKTEIFKMLADIDKRGEIEAALAASNPKAADAFGKTTPEDKAALRGQAITELRGLNAHLPENQQLREVTHAQFDQIKQQTSKRLGRPVSDTEMFTRFLPTDQ